MEEITRITTEYVDLEDRIRLAGETPDGASLILWLPQRLLNRLVPVLCDKLRPARDDDPHAGILNSFAQMAAVQNLAPLPPVRTTPEARSRTIRAVTVVGGTDAVQLLLKEEEHADSAQTSMTLRLDELRQWLSILHRQWLRAGWPPELWPAWMSETDSSQAVSPLLIN